MDELSDVFLRGVSEVLERAQQRAKTAVNLAMVYAYYEIGRRIVEEEQGGAERAAYGKQVVRGLSVYLTHRYGRRYSVGNLELMRRFYKIYSVSKIPETLFRKSAKTASQTTGSELALLGNESRSQAAFFSFSQERPFFLSWSHYLKLMRIENEDERLFYEIEAAKNDWSLAELKRQCDSALYERLALSTDKVGVRALAQKGQVITSPRDAIKDPYVLEFLGLESLPQYSEAELETRIIDHLQQFLLELGTGFTFVGRQVRFTFNEEHFIVDLVFYNRLLRCFVLFDLKIGELRHQDIGQMQMYVHHYDRNVRLPDENPTVGIILCKDKNDAIVEMTLPEDNKQIFASRYLTVLPSKETLKHLLATP